MPSLHLLDLLHGISFDRPEDRVDIQSDTSLQSAQNGFTTKFSTFLWIATTGSQQFLVWWYKSQPVFWLPRGWFPSILVWVLSFPSAPLGESFLHMISVFGQVGYRSFLPRSRWDIDERNTDRIRFDIP